MSRKILEEVRARKDTVYVEYEVIHEFSTDDEAEESESCFQYDPELLPPHEIDLDEIDEFLAQDILVAELIE